MHPKKSSNTFWGRVASVGRSVRNFFVGIWTKIKTACVKSKEVLKTQYKTANARISRTIGGIRQALVDVKEQLRKRFVRTQPTAEHS